MSKKTLLISLSIFGLLGSTVFGEAPAKRYRVVVKIEGFPSTLIESVKGKVYAFGSSSISGSTEWPIQMQDGSLRADIELEDAEDPVNLQAALVARPFRGSDIKATAEQNFLAGANAGNTIVLQAVPE